MHLNCSFYITTLSFSVLPGPVLASWMLLSYKGLYVRIAFYPAGK